MRASIDLCSKQPQQKPPPAVQRDRAGAIEQQPNQIPQRSDQFVAGREVSMAELSGHDSVPRFSNHHFQSRQPSAFVRAFLPTFLPGVMQHTYENLLLGAAQESSKLELIWPIIACDLFDRKRA